ncbi:hypothetical protein NLI96_g2910 [Meripilus lineatus]|uniref:AA9 family lytic polysaccharide monooxygenase n=1 Tax=Meripilus lineatus TaxID=2056292 RepID=A0AAD5V7U7_9APHY|nr:hypothetical protein NLI96_g2910 [Physisporinus lineatus]
MKKIAASVAIALSQIAIVSAHGGVTSWTVGSTTYPGWQPYNSAAGQVTPGRPYSSYNPILNAVDPTIHCNNDGSNSPTPQSITLSAGTAITAHWQVPEGVSRPGHPSESSSGRNGPTLKDPSLFTWPRAVPLRATASRAGLFRCVQQIIDEAGLLSGTVYDGTWANGEVMNTLSWTATVPPSLKAGAYLIRFELLALHQANTPQFYPECANLIVTGGGSAFPSSSFLAPMPGAWGANDPGVNIDIYSDAAKSMTTYPIPGPPLWTGDNSSAPPSNTPASPSTTAQPTSRPVASSTSAPVPSAPAGPAVSKYGQCGGIGYTGPTLYSRASCG